MLRIFLTFMVVAAIIVVADYAYSRASKREKRMLHGKMWYMAGICAMTLLVLTAIVAIF